MAPMKESKTKAEVPDFGIYIDFNKDEESPSNALKVLSELISTFEEVDEELIAGIGEKIKPIILLEDLEAGSIKAWLKNKIESVDDDGLKEMDWKKIVGSYLVKGKYAIIKFLEDKTEITDIREVGLLQEELNVLAKEVKISELPVYTPASAQKILVSASKISTSLKGLKAGNKATFIMEEERAEFNMEFDITPESMEDLLTKESLQSKSVMILKVKKPDYLGDSMWEMRHNRKPMEVKITDEQWLEKFKNREVVIKPGDSLKAEVITTVNYDFDNEVLVIKYEIPSIIEIIKPERNEQLTFPDAPQ